jgi:hypothetical protein
MNGRNENFNNLKSIILGTAHPNRGGTIYVKGGTIPAYQQTAVEKHELSHIMLFRSTAVGMFQTVLGKILTNNEATIEHKTIVDQWLGEAVENSLALQEGVASFRELYIVAMYDPKLLPEYRRQFPSFYADSLKPIEMFTNKCILPPHAKVELVHQIGRAAMQTDIFNQIDTWSKIVNIDPKEYFKNPKNNPDIIFRNLISSLMEGDNPEKLSQLIGQPYLKVWMDIYHFEPRLPMPYLTKEIPESAFMPLYESVRLPLGKFLQSKFKIDPNQFSVEKMNSWLADLNVSLVYEGLHYLRSVEFREWDWAKDANKIKGEIVYEPHAKELDNVYPLKTKHETNFDDFLAKISEEDGCILVKKGVSVHNKSNNQVKCAWHILFHPVFIQDNKFVLYEECYSSVANEDTLKKMLELTKKRNILYIIEQEDLDFATGTSRFGNTIEHQFVYVPPLRLQYIEDLLEKIKVWADDSIPILSLSKESKPEEDLLIQEDNFAWLMIGSENIKIITAVNLQILVSILTILPVNKTKRSKNEVTETGQRISIDKTDIFLRIAIARIWKYGV